VGAALSAQSDLALPAPSIGNSYNLSRSRKGVGRPPLSELENRPSAPFKTVFIIYEVLAYDKNFVLQSFHA
jgi:hypothetical protein